MRNRVSIELWEKILDIVIIKGHKIIYILNLLIYNLTLHEN